MKNQSLHFNSIALATAALSLWLLTPCISAAQTRIRLGTLLPQGTSQYQVLEKMGQDWRNATSGGVTLTIYGGGAMGSEDDSLRRMRIGQLQAATLSLSGLSQNDPPFRPPQKTPRPYPAPAPNDYLPTNNTA